ncbi:FAD-dependent oxidoreductase [Fluviispira multicolorata]|uniref:FAD-dependent oxidoreductase n=1 Tax=Fluviispira multicolorata TaxID=2654512 RepID=UPI0013762C1B|nr:FAD-dependent oxidoreductase [Fluviispira multicolorata]
MRVGIIGAGVLGRLIAIDLFKRNYKVTLYDKGDIFSSKSCSATAAGMLAPWSEAYESTQIAFELGIISLKLWPEILESLNAVSLLERQGTAHLALLRDKQQLENYFNRLNRRGIAFEAIEINKNNRKEFIGDYSHVYSIGYYFPNEATLNPREFILKCNGFFKKNNIIFKYNSEVIACEKNKISTEQGEFNYDLVINTMGIGAKKNFEASTETLRGVRGSLVLVNAPLVNVHSVIRLIHSRFPIYIVPRGNHNYIIGATSHETECLKPITVESLLELLSVASHFDKGFLEANLLEQRVNLRPTFTSNSPHFYTKDGVYFINGLSRNGITISPALANIFCNYVHKKRDLFLDNLEIESDIMEKLWLK